MSGMIDKHKETYRDEAYELLTELEDALIELEENSEDEELVGRVFRAMHTIKGSGAMFGFDDIAAFTHEVETVFDLVRSGKISVTKELIDITLASRDYIRTMLDASISGKLVDKRRGEDIIAGLGRLVPADLAGGVKPSEKETEPSEEAASAEITYRIKFSPAPDIFLKGTNPAYILDDLRQMGECNIVAQTKNIPLLGDMNPEYCYTYWDIVLTTQKGVDAIKDVFIFLEGESEVKIEVIDENSELSESVDYKKLGEILVERGDISQDALEAALKERKRIGEALVESGLVEGGQVESALIEQKHVQEVRKERQEKDVQSTIRVTSDKLDILVDLVGELVTVQARLSQISSQKTEGKAQDPELLSIAEEVERLTAELHDNTMSIRMVPIGTTFSKFRRLVRDLSAELGKAVRLTTEGAETELDKTVIERLNDPLVHLIRNSIDHGIEHRTEREAIGKPWQGTVNLSAMHSGANVLIKIIDDGKGLDPVKIKNKAIEKGLIAPDAEISEKEAFNLILLPGFSTAEKVTGTSGRGVGMDVVKRSIDSLRGSVDIESRKAYGTTITLRIPLTLAIIAGLLVRINDEFFVLPLSAIEECVELGKADISRSHGRHYINVRGEVVPYIRLREQFAIDGNKPDIEQVVIVNSEGMRAGFVVDSVVGEHQTVIKSLGRIYREVKGVSGATILGDGTVALILDVPKLIELAAAEEITY